MNNVLAGRKCYFGAPIQFVDSDSNWREPIKTVLRDRFEIDVFDPSKDPKQQWVPELNKAIETKNYLQMQKIARQFVKADLQRVDRADFVIASLPYKIPTVGTIEEIITSNKAKKPTLIVCPQGKEKISAWLFGTIKLQYLFGAWDDLYEYLEDVRNHKHTDDQRWSYVYGLI